MKPAPFDYVRPASLAEACEVLAGDEDARIIAGGQTLIPMLAMRLARPAGLSTFCASMNCVASVRMTTPSSSAR